MEQSLVVAGALKHTAETEADLIKEMRAYVSAQPGVRFLADVLTALHAPAGGLRDAIAFYASFGPGQVLQAFAQRPDLRVRLVRAITGGAPALLRRQSPADLAGQIELLVAEDLPAAERVLRAEEDRGSSVVALYFKYIDTTDAATYLPAAALWQYEGKDRWWTREPTAAARALMAAEIRSLRRHGIVSDSEILDLIGDDTFERDLPLSVRTSLRAAARKAAREGRPFRDGDLFACLPAGEGKRDLTDELCECVALPALRRVVERAAEALGWTAKEAVERESSAKDVGTKELAAKELPAIMTKETIAKDAAIAKEAAAIVKEAAAVVKEAGPMAVVVADGAARAAVKLPGLFTPPGGRAAEAKTPAPVSKAAAAIPVVTKTAAPPAPPPPKAKADPAARRPSQGALSPVNATPEEIMMAVDVPFAEDHLPNFTDLGDSDAVEEVSR